MRAITVQLSDTDYARLEEYKREHGGVPMAVIVRQAIICFFTPKYANKHKQETATVEAGK